MPAMNPTREAMSVAMCQFAPMPATTPEEVRRNIARIGDYVDRTCASFQRRLIVFPVYSTHGFAFDPYATHLSLASTIPGPETGAFRPKS